MLIWFAFFLVLTWKCMFDSYLPFTCMVFVWRFRHNILISFVDMPIISPIHYSDNYSNLHSCKNDLHPPPLMEKKPRSQNGNSWVQICCVNSLAQWAQGFFVVHITNMKMQSINKRFLMIYMRLYCIKFSCLFGMLTWVLLVFFIALSLTNRSLGRFNFNFPQQ